jgi:hypothetical protein
VVTFTALAAVCLDTPSFSLAGTSPSGGTFSGNGIQGNNFVAMRAGVGLHKLIYRYVDANNCSDTSSSVQRVDSLPNVNLLMPTSWCTNQMPLNLKGGSPNGGSYTVNGRLDSTYSSTISGIDTVVYSFTDANSCKSSQQVLINVHQAPQVVIRSLPDFCFGDAGILLTQGLPAGGTYSGTNVLGTTYTPGATGTDSIKYVFTDANSCTDSATALVQIHSLPKVVTASFSDVCENNMPFTLGGATPVGGSYSGNSVSNNRFNPSVAGVGKHTINYTFTDSNNCTNVDSGTQTVHAVTKASLSQISDMCDNDDTLSILGKGSPLGGIYSINTLNTDVINPKQLGAGIFNIMYTYTNTNSCTDSTSTQVVIEASPLATIVGDSIGCGSRIPLLQSKVKNKKYLWSNGSIQDTAHFRTSGKVWLQIAENFTNVTCRNSDTTTVTYDAICVGLNEDISKSQISYFPNPNSGRFSYTLSGFEGESAELKILSSSGQVISRIILSNLKNEQSGNIDLGKVENGVYFIHFISKHKKAVNRIIINR